MKPPVKEHWLDRAIAVHNFHVESCNGHVWTIRDTAKALGRSLGSVSNDLVIASWYRSHEKYLRRCRSQREAIAWIKAKQDEIKGMRI